MKKYLTPINDFFVDRGKVARSEMVCRKRTRIHRASREHIYTDTIAVPPCSGVKGFVDNSDRVVNYAISGISEALKKLQPTSYSLEFKNGSATTSTAFEEKGTCRANATDQVHSSRMAKRSTVTPYAVQNYCGQRPPSRHRLRPLPPAQCNRPEAAFPRVN